MKRLLPGLFALFVAVTPLFAQDQLILNGGFESGLTSWTNTHPNLCTLTLEQPGYDNTANAARWYCTADNNNTNKFLTQTGITLQKGKKYDIRFTAYSQGVAPFEGQNGGKDLFLYVTACDNATKSLGIANYRVNITTAWRTFTVRFTAKGFTTPTACAQLRIRSSTFYQIHHLDQVGITQVALSAADASDDPKLIEGPALEIEPQLYLPAISN